MALSCSVLFSGISWSSRLWARLHSVLSFVGKSPEPLSHSSCRPSKVNSDFAYIPPFLMKGNYPSLFKKRALRHFKTTCTPRKAVRRQLSRSPRPDLAPYHGPRARTGAGSRGFAVVDRLRTGYFFVDLLYAALMTA